MKGTCIVGIAHKGTVWMGCDSMASSAYLKLALKEPKIFRNGDMLFGVCGTVRIRDVIEFTTPPERGESMTSDREYLVRSYAPTLRNAMKDAGILETVDGIDEWGGAMLIGYRGKLYSMEGDFALMEQKEWATGSGCEYALGSLFSTSGEPQKRIKTALMAACEYSPSCGPPLLVAKL